MDDEFQIGFRDLTPEEVKEFEQWAKDNWTVNTNCKATWHPVIRAKWNDLDLAYWIKTRLDRVYCESPLRESLIELRNKLIT